MDRGNFRSLLSKLGLSRPANFWFADHDDSMTSAPALRRVVGRALGVNQSGNGLSRAGATMFDHLEQRSMLEGTFGTAIFVPLDGQGQGSATGAINPADPATNNDFFSFTAQQTDFVSILADTANEVTASALDTRITVYSAPNVNSLVGVGANNGVLTSGLARDGWLGFIAEAGTTYYVVVSSEGTAQGTYTLQINAQTVLFDVGDEPDEAPPAPTGIGRELNSPVPNPPFVPIAAIPGQIARRQQDVVFKYIAPTREEFDSLITVNAQSTVTNLAARLDTRIEVYNAQGQLITNAVDSNAGRINDAYTAFKGNPDEVFYIRVRSDEVRNANANLATGFFYLVFDSVATEITLNPVTRTASIPTDSFVGFGPALENPAPIPAPSFQTSSYEFTSRGNGLTIITVQPAGLAPVQDPAVRLYDANGLLVAFNDNFNGTSAQLEVELIGGERYFIVVDGFDVRGASQFSLNIESNHTFDSNPDTLIDDHVTNTNFPGGPLTAADRRIFEQATVLRLSDPLLTLDANRNPVRDRGVRATAAGTGRIHRAGDNDLFQFTAPVDMLMEYAGNNDDLGTSLFIGGNFQLADPNSAYPVTSRNLTTWDASDFWYAGAQYFDANFGVTYGFNDNPDTTDTDGARVYAMFDWDPNPTVTPPGGVTDRILMIGGDFDLIIPTPFGPATFRNLVGWAQNQQTGQWGFVNAIGNATIGSANGPVRAFTTFDPVSFDPDGSGPAEALPDPSGPVLVVGGEFSDIGGSVAGGAYQPGTAANNLATFDVALPGWTDIGLGLLDGGVFALATYDFVDPGAGREAQPDGTPPLGAVADVYDPPISVIIGGEFTGGVVSFDGDALIALDFTSPSQPSVNPFTDGPVYSIQVFNDNDPDGPTGPKEAASVLVLGGLFSSAGDLNNVGNLVKFGRPVTGAEADPADPAYAPRLIWETMTANGGGTEGGILATGAVLAMTVWDPPDINNTPLAPILVIGGDFSGIGGQATGNIGAYGNLTPNSPAPGALLALFGPGANGIVRTLATIVGGDDQEPSIASNLRTGNPQDPLYLGGDFTEVQFDPQAPPVQARGVAQFSAFRGQVADFFDFSRLSNGVANQVDATDPAAVPPQVFALAIFDDGNPFEWDRHDRRQTRLSVTLSPASGAFLNSFVRVFDSQFNIVYGFDRPGSDTISPPFPDPSGMIDGSLAAPTFNTQLEGVKLWGGETYYIEVSAGPTGGGTGRYNLSIVVDALPPDIPIAPATVGNSVLDDINALMQAEPLDSFFARAIKINTTLGTGDGTNIVGASQPPLKGNTIRQEKIRPSVGAGFVLGSDLGNISSLTDTDLYSFRAEFTGTAEIRLATTGIPDEFGEQLGNDFRGETKTLTSPLDGAMRIFDNDFDQLFYVDDTGGVTGEFQVFTTGGIAAPYYRRDPRVVFNVVAGNTYFIQVESGQRYRDGSAADPADRVLNLDREIDFRYATGGYVLVVNAMAQQIQGIENGVSVTDDHSDRAGPADNGEQASPINISNAGIGIATGNINNFNANPFDNDMFRFIAPGEGIMRIRFTPTDTNSTLLGALRLSAIGADNVATPVAAGQPIGNGVLEITTNAQAGQTFLVEIEGTSGTEGNYRVDITGIPFIDDNANAFKWSAAQDIRLLDFQGSGQVSGRIEVSGDTDIFRFTADQYANFVVTVVANEPTLTPAITIYEVSEDPRGNPLFLRLGVNDNVAGVNNPSVRFPVSPNRIIPVAPPGEDREYPYYYVIVRGRDPQTDRGTYTLNISLPTTDDHADGKTTTDVTPEFDNVEFPFATDITLDTQTGRGNETGIIEVSSDSDLFKFTAATSGEATIIISRPTDSLLRTRVSIVDADANIILDSSGFPAQATGEDSLPYLPTSVSINITRGQTYYVIVQGFNDPLEPNVNSTDIGAYTVSVNTPPIDDYPNVGEFTLSDVQAIISINSATGFGQLGGNAAGAIGNPGLNTTGDTDLFNFTTITAGAYNITVTPFDGVNPTGRFAPRVSLFIASPGGGTLVQTVQAPSALTPVTITIPNSNSNVKYYILVDARVGLLGATRTGEYGITIQGPTSGNGQDPGDVDFTNPTILSLNNRTGDVCFDDIINISGDRDLFRFTVSASGQVFVQLTTPTGSLLDASISIYNQANELITSRIAFDADGVAGVTASTSFSGVAGATYYAIVDGLGESVGSYQICVNSQPAINRLYFPEGFASDLTREFISIINSNSATANYTVYLRYEMGETETIIANGSVAAGARGGLTIIDGTNFQAPGIRKDTPYSVIIESDLPLGATMAHYDFGRSIGDSFTETLSTKWNFARVERDNGNVLDYVVFYNPSNFDIEVTLTAYQDGNTPVSLTKVFAANRRGGFSINDIPNFPTGVFSTILTAKAVDPANQAAFEGVAASLSHYDTTRGAAFGLIGEPNGGSTTGAVTNFLKGAFTNSQLAFFNANSVPVTVTLTGAYMRASLPNFSRTFNIQPNSQVIFTDSDFGLIADSPVGITYTSNLPVTVNSANYQYSDSDSSTASVNAGNRFLFGDAFIDPALAGNKFFEFLYIHNPAAANSTVNIRLNFNDGTSSNFNVAVNARGFAEVRLHERNEILSRNTPSWFGVDATSATPFTMTMTHYDLLLGGGWATTGVPVGFINPIARIP